MALTITMTGKRRAPKTNIGLPGIQIDSCSRKVVTLRNVRGNCYVQAYIWNVLHAGEASSVMMI